MAELNAESVVAENQYLRRVLAQVQLAVTNPDRDHVDRCVDVQTIIGPALNDGQDPGEGGGADSGASSLKRVTAPPSPGALTDGKVFRTDIAEKAAEMEAQGLVWDRTGQVVPRGDGTGP